MTRNLKALGLALVAVFAMSALAASAAQAQFTFDGGGEGTVTATANGNQVFESALGKVTCKKTGGTSAEFKTGATEITGESISYEECTGPGGGPATIDVPLGCHFLFTSDTNSTPKKEEVHLKCGSGESITITVFAFGTKEPHPASALICTFHIFANPTTQTFKVTYDNITLNGKMAVEVTANKVPVITTRTGTKCAEITETAEYTGNIRVTGVNTEGKEGITVT